MPVTATIAGVPTVLASSSTVAIIFIAIVAIILIGINVRRYGWKKGLFKNNDLGPPP